MSLRRNAWDRVPVADEPRLFAFVASDAAAAADALWGDEFMLWVAGVEVTFDRVPPDGASGVVAFAFDGDDDSAWFDGQRVTAGDVREAVALAASCAMEVDVKEKNVSIVFPGNTRSIDYSSPASRLSHESAGPAPSADGGNARRRRRDPATILASLNRDVSKRAKTAREERPLEVFPERTNGEILRSVERENAAIRAENSAIRGLMTTLLSLNDDVMRRALIERAVECVQAEVWMAAPVEARVAVGTRMYRSCNDQSRARYRESAELNPRLAVDVTYAPGGSRPATTARFAPSFDDAVGWNRFVETWDGCWPAWRDAVGVARVLELAETRQTGGDGTSDYEARSSRIHRPAVDAVRMYLKTRAEDGSEEDAHDLAALERAIEVRAMVRVAGRKARPL